MDISILRHSTAHVMAYAVKKLFKEVKLGIGPAIEDGFYYDFVLNDTIKLDDLKKIENKMQEIINSNIEFQKIELSKKEAIELLKKHGEKYKLELVNEIEDDKLTFYKTAEFIDLCKGPHINNTSEIKAFKLLKVSSCYWRSDERNDSMQRIYGTAFFTKEELIEHLNKLEEAEKRDHRRLAKELDLFNIYHQEGGAGLIYWHPKSAIIRRIIENFWIDEHKKRSYEIVYTPHIAKKEMWQISGHLQFYKENMYSEMDIEGDKYILKPMNCPMHILIYNSKKRSYRELPIRYAELGTVYRYERSGVLHGLLRVRGFTQDDAHIFCTEYQLKEEIKKVVELALFMMKIFGFSDYKVDLATRPEDKAGSDEEWDNAERILKEVLEENNIKYDLDLGGAVFYGPKIDIKIKDALGRLWQGPTIQFDFNLPRKFNMSYIDKDNKEKVPVMIHRAVLGSLERFFGCLIEHYKGAFPVWLAPIQVRVISITSRNIKYCEEVKKRLLDKNLRVDSDNEPEKINYKIREAELEKIPYMIIIGDKEEKENIVSVRKRGMQDLGKMKLEEFIKMLEEEIKNWR